MRDKIGLLVIGLVVGFVLGANFGCAPDTPTPQQPTNHVETQLRDRLNRPAIVDSLSGSHAGWYWTTYTDGHRRYIYHDSTTNELLIKPASVVPDSILERGNPKVVVGGDPERRGRKVKSE